MFLRVTATCINLVTLIQWFLALLMVLFFSELRLNHLIENSIEEKPEAKVSPNHLILNRVDTNTSLLIQREFLNDRWLWEWGL